MSLENWAANRWLEKLASDRRRSSACSQMRTGILMTIEKRWRAIYPRTPN